MKKYILIVFILILSFSGCATTGINFEKNTKSLILTNQGEKIKVANIISAKDTNKIYVVEQKGNSRRTTYIGDENSLCKVINVFKLLPLGTHKYYTTSVLDDLKDRYKGHIIKKYGQVYLGDNRYAATLAFETNGMHGVDSKTYINITSKCLNEFITKYKNNKKSIWYKPSDIIKN